MRQTLPPEPPAYPGERNRSPSPDTARRPSAVARSSTTRTSPGVSDASRRKPRDSASDSNGWLLSSHSPYLSSGFLPLAQRTRRRIRQSEERRVGKEGV